MTFKLETRDFILALIFSGLGILVTSVTYIKFLDARSPLTGLLIYYLFVYLVLFVLGKLRLIAVSTPVKILGATILTFAFFMIVNFESCYVTQVLGKSCDPVSNIYFQSEDGSVFWLLSKLTSDLLFQRISFILVIFVLTLFGSGLVRGKIRIFGG